METVLLFDVYKTLIDVEMDEENLSAYEALVEWLAYKGIFITAAKFRADYLAHCGTLLAANPYAHPDIDIGRVFRNILSGVTGRYLPTPLIEELALLFRIQTTHSLSLYPETIPTLDALQGQARLAIASNAQRIFTIPELTKLGLVDYFETIVFSSDVQVCKPDARIFQTACQQLELTPQQITYYIGDNCYDDVYGAQQLGIPTVWIDRQFERPFPEGIDPPKPTHTIENLAGLLSLI